MIEGVSGGGYFTKGEAAGWRFSSESVGAAFIPCT